MEHNTTEEAITLNGHCTEEQLRSALNNRYIIINGVKYCRVDEIPALTQEFIDKLINDGKLIDPKLEIAHELNDDEITDLGNKYEETYLNNIGEHSFEAKVQVHYKNGLRDLRRRFMSIIAMLQKELKEVRKYGQQALDEREVLIKGFDAIRKEFKTRSWLMEGRGMYPYNDDRYKEEVRYIMDAFDTIHADVWRQITRKSYEYKLLVARELGIDLEKVNKEKAEAWQEVERLQKENSKSLQFAEWLGNNNWKAVVCMPVDGQQVWEQGEQFNTRKLTSQLFSDFIKSQSSSPQSNALN